MPSHKLKTCFMPKALRRPVIEQRFGTMANFHKAADVWLRTATFPKDVHALTKIVEQGPCTEAQAEAVSDAIEYLVDAPKRVLDRCWQDYVDTGAVEFTLTLQEIGYLRAALQLGDREVTIE